MGKIKVCYLINGLGPGGAEMMLYRLLKHLDRDSYEPVVIALLKRPGQLADRISELGIPVNLVDARGRLDLGAAVRVYRLIKEAQPAILHTQLFASDIIGRLLGKWLRVPVVITGIRNIYFGGKLKEKLMKLTNCCADQVTVVCKAAAKRMVDEKIIPADKLRVIYNGLERDEFTEQLTAEEKAAYREKLGLKQGQFMLLAVGGMREQKGYPWLLEAAGLLERNDLKLVVAGDGKERVDLEAQLEELGLKEKVIFLGWSSEVPQLMAAADALVLSSLWEGLPGVVLEAMAAGLPVVATRIGGTPELVVDGLTGCLVPPKDACALAGEMERLMQLPEEKRLQMGAAGKQRAMENFSLEQMVVAYEELYRHFIKEKEHFG